MDSFSLAAIVGGFIIALLVAHALLQAFGFDR